ncbi:hypothetical protein ABPS01_06620 [Streptococcus sp. ZJ151]|uniref:hypothetical protein n=1 Tax=Streptococcus jiangjianxini TaxID=3161189 RepID=UPI0032EDD593
MTDKDKIKLESLRKENAIKNMYYTRYFLIRYIVTFFFFLNLYWILMLYLTSSFLAMILPIVLSGVSIYAMWEQTRMYTRTQKQAKATSLLFKLQILANVFIVILVLLGQERQLFPFLNDDMNGKFFIIAMMLLGILLATWMLTKLYRIDKKVDKQYRRIQNYLATVK